MAPFAGEGIGAAGEGGHALGHGVEPAGRNLLVVAHPVLEERDGEVVGAAADLAGQLIELVGSEFHCPGIVLGEGHGLAGPLGEKPKDDPLRLGRGSACGAHGGILNKAVDAVVGNADEPAAIRGGTDQQVTVGAAVGGLAGKGEVFRLAKPARSGIIAVTPVLRWVAPASGSDKPCGKWRGQTARTTGSSGPKWRWWNGPYRACSIGSR